MREFAFDEIYTYKCRVCGCKLKTCTDLVFDNKVVGYSLHCCNCGNTMLFPVDNDSQLLLLNNKTQSGKMRCYQPSYCPKKNICPLYGTDYIAHPENKPSDSDDDCSCGCKCGCDCCDKQVVKYTTCYIPPTGKFV